MKRLVSYGGIVFVILLTFITILPLLQQGLFPIHDNTQVERVYEMGKSLKAGLFPVRWAADLGYGFGYPIFNFYAPLAYYLGGFFLLIGFQALTATKIMIAVSILVSAVSMFFLGEKLWGKWGGIVSAVAYAFAPYHALNIYVRGDFSEALAFAFLPLIFLGLLYCHGSKIRLGIFIGSIGYALVILAHNLTAMMITPFVLLDIILLSLVSLSQKQGKKIFSYLSIVVFGILLSSFYWLPVLFESKYTNVAALIGNGMGFKDHFVCLPQLWDSPWGYAGSAKGCIDGLSFRIGKLHIVAALISFLSLFIFYKQTKNKRLIIISSLVFLLLGCFLMLPQSSLLWSAIPSMAFFQFPWRFLTIAVLFSSVLVGTLPYIAARLKVHAYLEGIIAAGMILSILLLYSKLFTPQVYTHLPNSYYVDEKHIKWTTSKISDEYMPPGFFRPEKESKIIIRPVLTQGPLQVKQAKPGYFSGITQSNQPQVVHFDVAYFPAWKLYIDGKETPYKVLRYGMEVSLPAGTHSYELRFVQTPLEKLGDALTLLSFALLLGIMIQYNYGKKTS